MKLKLEVKEGVAILKVLEKVAASDAAVLRAGIFKLVSTGNKSVVLDLCAAESIESEAQSEISQLSEPVREKGGQLVVVSLQEGLGHTGDLNAALAKVRSPLFDAQAQEIQLKKRLQELESMKEQLQSQLGTTDAILMKKERKSLWDIQGRIKELEASVLLLLQEDPPTKALGIQEDLRGVRKVALEVLQTLKMTDGGAA